MDVFFLVLLMIKALNVTRFSLPTCDVIATRQQQRKENSMANGRGEANERKIFKCAVKCVETFLALAKTEMF